MHSISHTPATDPSTEPEALIKEARQRRRRRWLVATVAVVVTAAAAAVAATGVFAGSGSGTGARPSPSSQTEPTAPARAPALVTVSETHLPKGSSLSLAVGYGAVWVTGRGVTYEVSEATGRIVRTIRTPGTIPEGCSTDVAAGAGGVWVTHFCRGVYRIDPHSGRVIASLRVPDAGDSIAVADGLVWVANYHGNVLRIRPRTGRIVGKPIAVGYGSWTLTPGAGALWVTSFGVRGLRPVSRIDLATGAVRRFGKATVTDIQAVGAGSLWTSQVQRVSPATGKPTASIRVPGPALVAFWKGYAWALVEVPRSIEVLQIDPATNRVTGAPVRVGKPLPARLLDSEGVAMTAGPTGLWVLDFTRGLLFHLALRSAAR